MKNTGRSHLWPAMISRRGTAFIYTIIFPLLILAIITTIISSSSARRRSCRLSNRYLLLVLRRRGRAARPAVTPGATCPTPTWSPRRSRAHPRRGWRSRRSTTGWSRACPTLRTKEIATVPRAGRWVTACKWGRVGAHAHERAVTIVTFLHDPQTLQRSSGKQSRRVCVSAQYNPRLQFYFKIQGHTFWFSVQNVKTKSVFFYIME